MNRYVLYYKSRRSKAVEKNCSLKTEQNNQYVKRNRIYAMKRKL